MSSTFFADIADEVRNAYQPNPSEELPYIGLEHIEQQTLHLNGVGSSKDVVSTKKKFQSGDILFGTLRPYFRKVVLTKNDGVCSTDIAVIRPKQGISSRFVQYMIADKKFIDHSMGTSNGTRMPRAKWGIVSKYPLPPNYSESMQQSVGATLGAYDDLIENNSRRIEKLEAMARLHYKKQATVVEGTTVLGSKLSIKKGKNITKATIKPGEVPVVAGGLQPAYYHNVPNAVGPVITVSASGANAGYTNIYYQDIWASDCSFIDSKNTPYVFFFYTLLAENQRGITHMQKGSAQPHVYPVDLERLEIPDFTDDAIKTLNEILSPIYDLIGVLKAKNHVLAKTRDLLLPHLMTGEIRL